MSPASYKTPSKYAGILQKLLLKLRAFYCHFIVT